MCKTTFKSFRIFVLENNRIILKKENVDSQNYMINFFIKTFFFIFWKLLWFVYSSCVIYLNKLSRKFLIPNCQIKCINIKVNGKNTKTLIFKSNLRLNALRSNRATIRYGPYHLSIIYLGAVAQSYSQRTSVLEIVIVELLWMNQS